MDFFLNIFYLFLQDYIRKFKFLASQEVYRLLHVSMLTVKEARRKFLTPWRGGLYYGFFSEYFLFNFIGLHKKIQISSYSGSISSPPCLHHDLQGSQEDVPDSLEEDSDMDFFLNIFIYFYRSTFKKSKFLASEEVFRLLCLHHDLQGS